MPVTQSTSKHQTNSAQTRERLINAAQKLYAEKGLHAVSFNEITVAAGQKNRNALQYHFGDRATLLQAIIDRHADIVYKLRRDTIAKLSEQDWPASKIAAHVLVSPIADYVASHADGQEYINIISQLAVANATVGGDERESQLSLHKDRDFSRIVMKALEPLGKQEASRRIFLAVRITFNSIADICRAAAEPGSPGYIRNQAKMVEQLIITIDSLFSAPPA